MSDARHRGMSMHVVIWSTLSTQLSRKVKLERKKRTETGGRSRGRRASPARALGLAVIYTVHGQSTPYARTRALIGIGPAPRARGMPCVVLSRCGWRAATRGRWRRRKPGCIPGRAAAPCCSTADRAPWPPLGGGAAGGRPPCSGAARSRLAAAEAARGSTCTRSHGERLGGGLPCGAHLPMQQQQQQ